MGNHRILETADPEVDRSICAEMARERQSLVLIASENYASPAVMAAQATVLTNKYAEGYPGARYYGGCEFVDQVERLAVERAKRLFRAEHANVQPHSGSQANMAAYLSLLQPGDTILGMELSHGGHLTHGSPVSFSGQFYKPVFYGVDRQTGRLDYDQVEDLAKKHRPRLMIVGASAYPRVIDFSLLREIADRTGAWLLADMAHIAGLVAVGLHPSPVSRAHIMTSTTHKTLRGPRGGFILCSEEYAARVDKAVFPGVQGGPLMHVIAAKAVAFGEALQPAFVEYQRQVLLNARTLAGELGDRGFDLVSGGTDNHLMLIDLTRMNLTGLEAERALGEAGIVVNKNSIPFEQRSPRITSGLRLGTPAATSRGMKEPEMKEIAGLIQEVLRSPTSESTLARVRIAVHELCERFPVYRDVDA